MRPSDEDLLHAFYAGDDAALEEIRERYDSILARFAQLFLFGRGIAMAQVLGEWDTDERVNDVWVNVYLTRMTNMATWPHLRMSVLRWFIYLLCEEMDRHLGFEGPF
jgi:hypothetical protein